MRNRAHHELRKLIGLKTQFATYSAHPCACLAHDLAGSQGYNSMTIAMHTQRLCMRTRRTLLSGALALAGACAAVFAAAPGSERPNPNRNSSNCPETGASGAKPPVSLYPSGDVRRYGLVPNCKEAAAENTRALKTLVAPSAGFRGNLTFPNTTGSDVYYLSDIIPFNDGIRLDLQGSTLHFSKAGVKGDTNAGFIFAVRDFTIENGFIVVDYQMGEGATNAGNALTFGNRGSTQDSGNSGHGDSTGRRCHRRNCAGCAAFMRGLCSFARFQASIR